MQRKTLIGIIFVLIGFIGFGVAGWFLMKDRIVHRAEYRLSAEKITVTPSPPAWVSEQFVAEALKNSALDTESTLFDTSLPQKLSQAFAAAPWVEQVQQVQLRYPSGAVVKLVYRSPAALVEMATQGLYPVDGNGVLLPTDYFNAAPEKMNEYPRITGIRSTPIGTVGTPWGDTLVEAAAQLAKHLDDISAKQHLVKIIPSSEATPTGNRTVLRLRTENGTEILWGDDPTSNTKKKRLLEIAELYHSLDSVPENFRPVDLSKD